ncbi:MAG: tyrosine-type recombinase/integrase [Rubripirellula sp.]
MNKLPKISICQRRGAPHFRWYVGGAPRYRKIKDPANVEQEKLVLATELLSGIGKFRERHRTRDEHLRDWRADMETISAAQADLTYKRAKRVLNEAKISTILDVSIGRVRTTVHGLRCSVRDPKKKLEDYALLSEQSRKHHMRAVKQFYKWLEDEGRIDKSPIKSLKLKKVVEERNPRDRLQPEELSTLVEETRNSDRVIENYTGEFRAWAYVVAVMTGLRRKEIAKLQRESFDWESRTVSLSAAYTKDKELAVLPLNRRMVQDLKLWIADRKGQLFPDFEIKRTSKMIKRDLVAAGLPVRTESGTRCFHSLRNTYISSLFDAGRNIAQVQRLARHSDPRLTMKYAKPRSDEWALVDDLNYPGHDP